MTSIAKVDSDYYYKNEKSHRRLDPPVADYYSDDDTLTVKDTSAGTTIDQRQRRRVPKISSKSVSVPMIAFVAGMDNSKLLAELSDRVGPNNVFDLNTFTAESVLMNPYYRCRDNGLDNILVVGEDRVFNEIVDVVESLGLLDRFTLCPIPDQNDFNLARHLRWTEKVTTGTGNLDLLDDIVHTIAVRSHTFILDRWNLTLSPSIYCGKLELMEESVSYPGNRDDEDDDDLDDTLSSNFVAGVCLGADARRKIKCKGRLSRTRSAMSLSNNIPYISFTQVAHKMSSFKDYMQQLCSSNRSSHIDLSAMMSLKCDGLSVNERLKQLKPDTLLILNVNSHMDKYQPWGATPSETGNAKYEMKWRVPECNDGLLEVVAYNTARTMKMRFGGRGHRLSQCKRVDINLKTAIPATVDGKPYVFGVSKIAVQQCTNGVRCTSTYAMSRANEPP